MNDKNTPTGKRCPALPSVTDLTLEEKASLTSGGDAWHLQGIEHKGIPGYMITDGPHGLRKSVQSDSLLSDGTVPATCFPPAAGLSSSWNPALIREVGEAMGEECVQEKVAVILGPGVNIKRNPLGGRNFEYWSEDPYLAGHEAVGIVEGVQSKGVGTSLKHLAANNQETDRIRIDETISPRALREIYLPAFEHIVKTAQPWTIMCSYNKINGVYSSENRWLLTDVLRGEWGFKGIVMSDWGAVHDRVKAIKAGVNLEMPPSRTDDRLVQAVHDGLLDESELETLAQGMIDLIGKTGPAMSRDGYRYDTGSHAAIARRAAAESIVLLKNENAALPLNPNDTTIAVIGEFARTPRYQGSGSSRITPTKLVSFLDAMTERGIHVNFAPGFTLDDQPQDPSLTDQAIESARDSSVAIVFLGLPETAESEGYDRTSMDLPAKQLAVLDQIHKANKHVIVVLSNGSAVRVTPWRDQTEAILESWLLGQEGGHALADVILGDADPTGRLAQSIPLDTNDDPSMLNWPGENGVTVYGEDIYVGYRYYDTFNRPVAYPFGHGLSYAEFTLDNATCTVDGTTRTATVNATLTNTSERAGSQVVQLYVAPPSSKVRRPVHELKAFTKVHLEPGESTTITMQLDERAFAYWSVKLNDWHVEEGDYTIELGFSSRDIRTTVTAHMPDDGKNPPLGEWSTIGEWKADPIGRPIVDAVLGAAFRKAGITIPDDPTTQAFINDTLVGGLGSSLGDKGRAIASTMIEEYNKATEARQR